MSKFFLNWVGEAKILHNIQGGLNKMLIIAYIVGGWVQKTTKKCLRNIWMVPKQQGCVILKGSFQRDRPYIT